MSLYRLLFVMHFIMNILLMSRLWTLNAFLPAVFGTPKFTLDIGHNSLPSKCIQKCRHEPVTSGHMGS